MPLEFIVVGAAYEGHQAAIEYLLAEGANVNAADQKGWTALSWAVKTKRLPIAEYLLQRKWLCIYSSEVSGGSSLSIVDTDGFTLSDIARASNNVQLIDYIELVRSDQSGQIAAKVS